MDNQAIWDFIIETWSAIGAHYEPVLERYASQVGLSGRGWGILWAVLSFEPETTTPAHLLVRSPYTSVDHYLTRLRGATEKGLLYEVSPGEFQFTPAGRELTNKVISNVREVMAKVDPLPQDESSKLSDLLDRLVKSCLDNPPPPDPWSINLSYKLMPKKVPPLPYIEQAFTCLAAYRDDSHLAAWQKSGLSATGLETLTCFWRNQVHSMADICELLSNRGHLELVYFDALYELRERGLLEGANGSMRITDDGKYFRDQIEVDTNLYFFAPWRIFSQHDRQVLFYFLNRLRDGLMLP